MALFELIVRFLLCRERRSPFFPSYTQYEGRFRARFYSETIAVYDDIFAVYDEIIALYSDIFPPYDETIALYSETIAL